MDAVGVMGSDRGPSIRRVQVIGGLAAAVIAGVLAAIAVPHSASAHQANNVYYPHKWGTQVGMVPHWKFTSSFPGGEFRDRTRDAAATWNNVATAQRFQEDPQVQDPSFNPATTCSPTPTNYIFWRTMDGPFNPATGTGGIVGSVTPCYTTDDDGQIFSRNVTIDREENWYTGTGAPLVAQPDYWSVITHELGHATGFNPPFFGGHFDPNDQTLCGQPNTNPDYQTMCPKTFLGDTSQRSLATHDLHTYQAAYSEGYWRVASNGAVTSLGSAGYFGSAAGIRLAAPIVGMAATPSFGGYWLIARDGGIFTYGNAGFYGSTGSLLLNAPIVGMAPTPSGSGYWLVAADGGIFSFGDAGFYGSTGGINLNQPVVGMAATPSGGGYWLVARDGGIFSFGDAGFYGSTGGTALNSPIVGMAATPSGGGYWLAAADGGVFTFGNAGFFGSAAGGAVTTSYVGITRPSDGGGYWLGASSGLIHRYGTAAFYGSAPTSATAGIVGIAGKG